MSVMKKINRIMWQREAGEVVPITDRPGKVSDGVSCKLRLGGKMSSNIGTKANGLRQEIARYLECLGCLRKADGPVSLDT